MDTNKEIEAAFARANVPLRITNRSLNRNIVRGARDIVQMDIGRDSKGKETIRMNIPDGGDVRVLGGDADHQQVVVMVHEPELKFEEQIWNPITAKMETRIRRTPEGNRRFLVGMDECHLFIAQLTTNCTTVKQAHEGLRPKTMPKGRKAKKAKVKRTGEYFLAPITVSERIVVADHIKAFGVERKVGLGTGKGRGRPHVVDERIRIKGIEFARGKIRHPDHAVVELKDWHRVSINTEDRSADARWVD